MLIQSITSMRSVLAWLLLKDGVAAEAAKRSTGVEEELEPSMQTFQRIAITAVFTLTCFTVPVLRAATLESGTKEDAEAGKGTMPSSAASGAVKNLVGGEVVSEAASKKTLLTVPGQVNGSGLPLTTKPEWAAGTPLAEQVKQITEQFRKEQQDLLNRYNELLKKSKDGSTEERDRMREQVKKEWDKLRDDLIAKQKDLRDAIRRQFNEFKQLHPDHQDLIEAAKERAKDRVRDRRGHVGN
jgi:ElaB/YqjD/DUF883 family membrane-anchored ribosome-binding protein